MHCSRKVVYKCEPVNYNVWKADSGSKSEAKHDGIWSHSWASFSVPLSAWSTIFQWCEQNEYPGNKFDGLKVSMRNKKATAETLLKLLSNYTRHIYYKKLFDCLFGNKTSSIYSDAEYKMQSIFSDETLKETFDRSR